MVDEDAWRVTRDDSDDLGFALSCLSAGAVTLDEFHGWIALVLVDSDDYPHFLIELLDVDQRHEVSRRWREMVGFQPAFSLSRTEEKALVGIAYARFADYRHDTVRRGAAQRALSGSPAVRARFARSFPTIEIPEDARDDAPRRDRGACLWWFPGAENRPVGIAEVQTALINQLSSGAFEMVLESDTALRLRIVTRDARVHITLSGPDGDAQDADGGALAVPEALRVMSHVLAHGALPPAG